VSLAPPINSKFRIRQTKTRALYAYRGARAIVCNAKEAGFYVTRSLTDENPLKKPGAPSSRTSAAPPSSSRAVKRE